MTALRAADRPVVLAVVVGAHGVRGEVKLKLFTDELEAYGSLNGGMLTLATLRGNIARFVEVSDRTAAERLRGTELTVPRSALPPLGEGEYYHCDLIGLPACTTTGEAAGEVVAVENFGAGDLLEIAKPDGKRVLVPMRPEAVPEWGEQVVVAPEFLD